MKGTRRYKDALLDIGFEQLDVYEHASFDILRLRSLASGSVMLVRLPKHRKDLSIDEFKRIVRREIGRYEKRKNIKPSRK